MSAGGAGTGHGALGGGGVRGGGGENRGEWGGVKTGEVGD